MWEVIHLYRNKTDFDTNRMICVLCSLLRGWPSGTNSQMMRRHQGLVPIGDFSHHEEGRKEMFYLTTHSTHLFTVICHQTYGKGPFRKLLPLHELPFLISSKASFYMYHPTDKIGNNKHILCYTSCGLLAGMRYTSMGPP